MLIVKGIRNWQLTRTGLWDWSRRSLLRHRMRRWAAPHDEQLHLPACDPTHLGCMLSSTAYIVCKKQWYTRRLETSANTEKSCAACCAEAAQAVRMAKFWVETCLFMHAHTCTFAHARSNTGHFWSIAELAWVFSLTCMRQPEWKSLWVI